MHQYQPKHLAIFSAARASCTDACIDVYTHTQVFTSIAGIGMTISFNAVVPNIKKRLLYFIRKLKL